MTTRMITNQKRAFLTRAMDSARRLADDLRTLSPAQQAAILALIARQDGIPVDITMIGEPGDWNEAREVLTGQNFAGGVRMDSAGQWELGSGCHFVIEELPR